VHTRHEQYEPIERTRERERETQDEPMKRRLSMTIGNEKIGAGNSTDRLAREKQPERRRERANARGHKRRVAMSARRATPTINAYSFDVACCSCCSRTFSMLSSVFVVGVGRAYHRCAAIERVFPLGTHRPIRLVTRRPTDVASSRSASVLVEIRHRRRVEVTRSIRADRHLSVLPVGNDRRVLTACDNRRHARRTRPDDDLFGRARWLESIARLSTCRCASV
jgi:hypothetical protein